MDLIKNIGSVVIGILCLVVSATFHTTFVVHLKRKSVINNDVWYFMLYLILAGPEIIYLLNTIWKASYFAHARFKRWPETKFALMGFLLTILETLIKTYFIAELLPLLPSYILPVLLSCSAFPNIIKNLINENWKCLGVFSGLLFIGGCVLLHVMLVLTEILNFHQSTLSVVCIFLLGIMFYDPLRNLYTGSYNAVQENSVLMHSLLRCLTLSFTLYFCYTKGILLEVRIGTSHLISASYQDYTTETYIVIVNLVCGIILQFYRFIPRQKCRYVIFFAFPLFLGIIGTCVIEIVLCLFTVKELLFIYEQQCINYMDTSWQYIVLYTVCSALMALLTFTWCMLSSRDKGTTKKHISSFSYSSCFIINDIAAFFNPSFHDSRNSKNQYPTGARIFVCTTMYQEAKHEMNRLLKSLNKLSESKLFKRKDVYMESHIFLDNGADGKDVRDFGIQLLSLIEHNFQIDDQYGNMTFTPYGICFSWEIPGKIPLNIHLKDNKKVKAKKRWSQVMYMEFILNYRSKQLERERISRLEGPVSDSLESLDVGVYMGSASSSSEGSQSNTLHVPLMKFDMGSKTSSYSSLTNVSNLEDEEEQSIDVQHIHSTEHKGDNPVVKDLESLQPEMKISENIDDGIIKNSADTYTEYSYKFDRKSLASSENPENNIFTISGSDTVPVQTYDDYILATDADMSFDENSVVNLLNTCQQNPEVGGVCGRTYPIGIHWHPIVWLQMFDYAKDFWMIKSATNVIGSVMCCPGCFSLYRFKAIRDVFDTYSEPTQSMEDIFTKDNGEDRWMCTLMMLKGWSLRYNGYGRNSTYCPEETEEFMKQRRRWLLSDFANAIVVVRNIGALMKRNTCFTVLYAVYILQLFLVMFLYPGSTIMMLSLGFELVTGVPLLAVAGALTALVLGYCVVLVSGWSPTRKLVVSKLYILGLGVLTMYIFIATAIVIADNMVDDFSSGTLNHLQNFVLVGVAATYLYSAVIHPTELWLLSTGIIYLFYLPLLNVLLPLYAVCNIVDQTWGTRDDQKASVPSILRMPKLKKRRRKKHSIKVRFGSYQSLSSSALDLSDINETETEFWKHLVQRLIGKDVNPGISQEARDLGLRRLRNRALVSYLSGNILWIILLCGFYEFLIQNFEDKTVYGIVIIAILGISPLIQLIGMTVYKVNDALSRIASFLS